MKETGALQVTTPSDREIAMTRVLEAPRRLVFDAWTRPELLERWLGVFGDWSMVVCEVDLRVGGGYRFLWRGHGGKEMGMRGEYREVVVPERLVTTEVFDEPWYPGGALATLVLVEAGGRTTAATTVRYDSKEIRDAVLEFPMEQGAAASYEKLDELLATAP